MGIVLAILLFGFIVFFHELGHFLLAKKNKIDVDEFAVGMGPALFQKTYKGTRYSIRLLPIGGYCAMGEDEEATDSPNNFNNKSVWARISVIAAGPVFNFILAWIFSVILIFMIGYDQPVIGSVEDGYPAAEAGLQEGDRVVRIGDKNIHIYREISAYLQFHPDEDVVLTYERDGEEHTVTLTPKMDEELGYERIGLASSGNTKANLLTAFQYGTYEVKYWIEVMLDSLRMLVTGQAGIQDLSGPVGIVNVVNDVYESAAPAGAAAIFLSMLNFGTLLTVNLGILNLLPLPALDGGRLVFLIIEAVRRKRVPPEKEGMVHFIGFAALMLLMVVVMYNDIMKLF